MFSVLSGSATHSTDSCTFLSPLLDPCAWVYRCLFRKTADAVRQPNCRLRQWYKCPIVIVGLFKANHQNAQASPAERGWLLAQPVILNPQRSKSTTAVLSSSIWPTVARIHLDSGPNSNPGPVIKVTQAILRYLVTYHEYTAEDADLSAMVMGFMMLSLSSHLNPGSIPLLCVSYLGATGLFLAEIVMAAKKSLSASLQFYLWIRRAVYTKKTISAMNILLSACFFSIYLSL